MDAKIAHLGFIQSIISRMAGNSFLLKGWSVTLIVAIFALSGKDSNHNFVLLAYLPTIVFWWLDAFFLRQEKLFRKLYERMAASTNTDFSLDTSVVADKVSCLFCVAFSKTLAPFHLGILLVVIVVNIIIVIS